MKAAVSCANRIVSDSRHEEPIILEYAEVDAREFTDWSMAFVSSREVDEALVRKYAPTGDFDPYVMRASAVRKFLISLAHNAKELLDSKPR